jgi:iron complex outermembrane recepter protein
MRLNFTLTIFFFLFLSSIYGQIKIKGEVYESTTGQPAIGATVQVEGAEYGAITDYDGVFEISVPSLPVVLNVSYIGFKTAKVDVVDAKTKIKVNLEEEGILVEEVKVVGQRVSDKQKQAPLTVESLDAIAIKQTASTDFYNGLGALKGVDLTTASIGFTVINTRGFNSTSPVRSLQIIDGVDNQAPGLNFSLGNFLGSSELDIQKVDLVAGASSAFYGPNAFNGVISMETKNPFFHKGLAASIKLGERNMLNTALRYADAFKNKSGKEFFAYKLNLSYLKADDWVADNYDPISTARVNDVFNANNNPGGSNKVNFYGDEDYVGNDFVSTGDSRSGLNTFNRTGYQEKDIVDYNTKNTKANIALHFRTQPSKDFESPELILSSNYGNGTTVYQGDNRFSLRDIQFYQNKIEFRKRDKFFIRAYATNEDAGNSYDPYFTALKMQQAAKGDESWSQSYQEWWVRNDKGAIFKKMQAAGYPSTNQADQIKWQQDNANLLADWHRQASDYANFSDFESVKKEVPFFVPGTARYDSIFNAITSRKNNSKENGTRFFDQSALYHVHGEYKFSTNYFDDIVVGANARVYRPFTDGTIFSDSVIRITNSEYGVYSGVTKKNTDFIYSATLRMDKNQNFNYLLSPAFSIVWNPSEKDYLRLSFSSAIRNPTLSDQYLNLNVGPATLLGNLNGFNNLVSFESFQEFRKDITKPFLVENVKPISPEKVKTAEIGYRTTLLNNTFLDASYFFNYYNDFIGYKIGLTIPYDSIEIFPGFPKTIYPVFQDAKIYRVSANSDQSVISNGFSIGINHYFAKYYSLSSNYSYNALITKETDNIVPAFNTPKNKVNFGISGRDLPMKKMKFGFNVNYKWIEQFDFEGSPQFTGVIPSYSLMDAQVTLGIPKAYLSLKLGASNILNNKQFQSYGGPRIGRMAYIAATYDFVKKIN